MKEGDHIKFWSNKVFGVPVPARIKRIYKSGKKKGYLVLSANYWGNTWIATVNPGRICEKM